MHGDEAIAHAGVATLYHGNQQFSVTALSDSSGNISERYAYTAYGQPTFLNSSGAVQTSSAASNRYTYTGREWDATLGLYHFRARWMSGLTGRFLTRDPSGFTDGKNLYVTSFAMKGVDPSGMIKITNVGGSLGGKNGDVGCDKKGIRDWQFELESDAPCNGYFIQHVVKVCIIRDCEKDCCSPLSKSRISMTQYWEAWSVTKGNRIKDPIPRVPEKLTDTASLSAPDDTCGMSIQIGEAHFYCKDPKDAANGVGTGNLSDTWEYGQTYGFGTECESRTGRLYSTGSQPGFWGNGPIETGSRMAQLNWKCCKGANDNFAYFGANP
jgi:RHS repeat-associated protein